MRDQAAGGESRSQARRAARPAWPATQMPTASRSTTTRRWPRSPIPRSSRPRPSEPRYKTPLQSGPESRRPRDSTSTCEASHTVVVVDTAARRKVAEIPVGGQPTDVTFSPDGRRAFVSNRLDDTVSVIDVAQPQGRGHRPGRRRAARRADRPRGQAPLRAEHVVRQTSRSSTRPTLKEVKRLSASRGPWALALSPDGSRLLVTNTLSRFVKFRTPSMSEVTVIDTRAPRWSRPRRSCRRRICCRAWPGIPAASSPWSR